MTPAEAEDLGRRWIAAGGGWRDGMLGKLSDGGPIFRVSELNDNGDALHEHSWWPDLRDPATRGAALEVVRERWGDPETYAKIEDSLWTKKRDGDGRKWIVITGDGRCIATADTEPEALVAALEAAPVKA